jgi:hypothetical protein
MSTNNSPVLCLFVQVLGRRSIFIFFRSIFLATPIEVLVNFLVLSALTILSRSTDLCHLFQSRDCHCSFRTKAEAAEAVGESCPYFGGSAPDDPPSSPNLHEASRDAELPCGDNGS